VCFGATSVFYVLHGMVRESLGRRGKVVRNKKGRDGDVEVRVVGAEPNQTYDVVFRSSDGSTEAPVDVLVTDRTGNGWVKLRSVFFGEIGSGNIVLKRNGQDQFVTGFVVNPGVEGKGKDKGKGRTR